MPDPIKWKSKIILAKIETTYGVDSTPTGAANAMLMTNVSLKPMEGQDVSRNLEQAFIGAQEELPVGLYSVLEGSVELAGSGTAGEPPAWGPLLRACGVAETIVADTDVEYTPVTDNQESCSIYFWIGPSKYVLLGARGTVVFSADAQGIPVGKFTITGKFAVPSDVARVTPDLSSFQVPQVATNANTPVFTIGGSAFVLRSFTFDLANDIQQRLLIGRENILVVDRNELVSSTVEAVPLATYNPYQVAQDRTRKAIVLTHGTIAGSITSFSFPTCAQKRPAGLDQNQNILEWPLQFTPLQTDGDDQWTITLT